MIRISSIFLLSFLPAILCAQTYVVKIFPCAYFSELDNKKTSNEIPTIEVSKKNQEEFLKADGGFFKMEIKAGEALKMREKSKTYVDNSWRTEEAQRTLLLKANGDNAVTVDYKFLKTVKISATKDKPESQFTLEEVEVFNKPVNLGVLTFIYLDFKENSVTDSVPVWGDLPFIGKLFQSKGVSRQAFGCLVLITKPDENNMSERDAPRLKLQYAKAYRYRGLFLCHATL